MKKINVAFGIHNHQPVGNFDFVFEEAYRKAYLPFLQLLERHPKIRMAQHYTGILFQWLKENQPDFLPLLRKLVARGQVEMMTGGFYEPIMSVIPDRDKVGQIRKLTEFVKENTGYDAKGMWLAERIWEPHLPKPVAEAGIEYLVLDDSHFKNAGLKEDEILGYYLTEEAGRTVFLFPISEKLRYTIPFEPPANTLDYLRSIATEDGSALAVFADDGEKFGIWPNTYEHCYENGWLESFFQALEDNSDWINIVHLSEAITLLPPRGRIYLPTASYREMMEWAMPTRAIGQYQAFDRALRENELFDKYKVFVRGGFWRNFMVKYPEANNMHKKMLRLCRRLEALEPEHANDERFKRAQDHIWAGQCNCPYWHGVFGGLYLPHLRFATYNQFIQAETLFDALQHPPAQDSWLEVSETDFDCDGQQEVLVSNPRLNVSLAPHRGGAVFEMDFKPVAINLLDTMTRREESYHAKLRQGAARAAAAQKEDHPDEVIPSIHDLAVMKEEGLDKLLFYDAYRRMSCLDHFFAPGVSLEKFSQSNYTEAGDFIEQPYECAIEKNATEATIVLRREGRVTDSEGKSVPVRLEKRLIVDSSSSRLRVHYAITNRGREAGRFWFGSEWGFSLLAGDAPDRYFVIPGEELRDKRLRSSGEVDNATEVRLIDEWLKLRISLNTDRAATLWRFPIETISQSESGFERVYQSSVVVPNWKFELTPGAVWKVALSVEVNAL